MNRDLERSVRVLNDSLSTPKKSLFKIKQKDDLLNLSATLNDSEYEHLLGIPSAIINNTNLSFINTFSKITEKDKSVTGSVIQAGLPWKSATDSLYSEYATIMQNESEENNATNIAAELGRCCSDVLTAVQKLKSHVNISEVAEEKWLTNERNIWRLLFALYQDRLQDVDLEEENEFSTYIGNSEKLCIDELFRKNSILRESQLVIDWLEMNEFEKDDPILHFTDWTCGWEHTLHQLLVPENIAIGSNTDIVPFLHPDVVQSEGSNLHHLDQENDDILCRRMFREIRCGKLESAQELCFNCGHSWRAAMLEGWKLYHNPNIQDHLEAEDNPDVMDDDNLKHIEGNVNRDLWKVNALTFCKKNLNLYEIASIGSLCGYVEAVLPVLKTWEDHLWAYLKAMVDIKVETEIRENIFKTYEELPETYWQQKMTLNEIFQTLEVNEKDLICEEAQEIDHIIQKMIILNEIPNLLNRIEEWSSDKELSTHSLRFFAHLVLFFERVTSTDREINENIIQAYIQRLSEMDETQMLAFYVSKLSKSKQVPIYAAHIQNIIDKEDRRNVLDYAESVGLDVLSITSKTVENIRNLPNEIDGFGNLNKKITRNDEIKISSGEWLTFYEEQRVDSVLHTNKTIFTFLAMDKLDAAHQTISKLPQCVVEQLTTINNSENNHDKRIDSILRDHFCYKTYLSAQEAFSEWLNVHSNRPHPVPKLEASYTSGAIPFTERVAYEHRIVQHKAEMERWSLTSRHTASRAKQLFYNVLQFPGGWLEGGAHTVNEQDHLRALLLPQVVILLYGILSESDCHEEAVRLVDVIASEEFGIYKVYTKERLEEILEKFGESSTMLLKDNKDPWGAEK